MWASHSHTPSSSPMMNGGPFQATEPGTERASQQQQQQSMTNILALVFWLGQSWKYSFGLNIINTYLHNCSHHRAASMHSAISFDFSQVDDAHSLSPSISFPEFKYISTGKAKPKHVATMINRRRRRKTIVVTINLPDDGSRGTKTEEAFTEASGTTTVLKEHNSTTQSPLGFPMSATVLSFFLLG